jgi:hypothetical protein
MKLSDISSVDDGSVAEHVLLFRGFRIRLREGKDKLVALLGGHRSEWITAINELISAAST